MKKIMKAKWRKRQPAGGVAAWQRISMAMENGENNQSMAAAIKHRGSAAALHRWANRNIARARRALAACRARAWRQRIAAPRLGARAPLGKRWRGIIMARRRKTQKTAYQSKITARRCIAW
jgi:hypothetical protein